MVDTKGGQNVEVAEEFEFSLAELANLNTDEIKALKSRLPMAGVWTVVMTSVALGMYDAKPEEDKGPLPYIEHKMTSISIEPAKKTDDFDPSTTADRKLSQRSVLWNNSQQALLDEIGYMKGNYQKVGFETNGILGGLTEQGNEPGWLDYPVLSETPFKMRVRHGQRNGQDVAYIDWLGPVEAIGEGGEEVEA